MARSSGPIRVLAVDDHPLIREGVAALIANHPDIVLVAEACDGHQALEACRQHRPDVVLLDLQMPGLSGIDVITAIRGDLPGSRIIVLTTYGGDDLARRALSAGAQAYILKSSVRTELLETIRAVHKGHKRINAEVADALANHLGDERLSARELDVLKQLATGKANKAIAAELSISEETVKGHIKNILSKMRANDRTHAVALGVKRGILVL